MFFGGQRRRKGKNPHETRLELNSNHMHRSPCHAGLCCHLWVSRGSAVSGAPASSLRPEGWIPAPAIREEGQPVHSPSLGMTSLSHLPQGAWWGI